MAGRQNFSDEHKLYYVTFTCYDWLPLIKLTDGYDIVYEWFRRIKAKYNIQVASYVIMPNHIHCILNFPEKGFSLNTIIKQGKIFMARKILDRLKASGQWDVLTQLSAGVATNRQERGQKYCVFNRSFDAKAILSRKFLEQKVNYIHLNPVRGNYNLVEDWRDYPHSSAGFYEFGNSIYFNPVHFSDLE